MSAVTVQGVPAEIYMFGWGYFLWFVGVFFAAVISAYSFVPLYYPLKITCVNEVSRFTCGGLGYIHVAALKQKTSVEYLSISVESLLIYVYIIMQIHIL